MEEKRRDALSIELDMKPLYIETLEEAKWKSLEEDNVMAYFAIQIAIDEIMIWK